jgi:hypothetical protein
LRVQHVRARQLRHTTIQSVAAGVLKSKLGIVQRPLWTRTVSARMPFRLWVRYGFGFSASLLRCARCVQLMLHAGGANNPTCINARCTSEVIGTAVAIWLGQSVVANELLPRTKGHAFGHGWLSFGK